MYVVLVLVTGKWFVWGHCTRPGDAAKAVGALVKQGYKATSVYLS